MSLTEHRSRWAALTLAAVAAFAAVACAPTPVPTDPPDERIVVTDDAHLDVVSVELHGDHLHVGIDHSDHEELLHSEDVVLAVDEAHRSTVGTDPGFAPLGAAGADVWTLDGGWSAHGAAPGDLADDTFSLHVLSVDGPGQLGVWRADSFGVPTFDFSSSSALPQALDIASDAHAHRNWSFTAPGEYTVEIEVSATLAASGEAVSSGVQRYTFRVGGVAGQDDGGHDHDDH